MQNILVHRYTEPGTGYQGWIEPDDLTWILFVDDEGHVTMFDKRDPETGAVID